MDNFEIPIVMILFKRADKTLEILKRIAEVKPSKLYLLSDEGRNDEEKKMVARCRSLIEENITWDCEVMKNYAPENRGVYENIGLGAKWVFEREPWAIFLEDDNLPELTFFQYCKELLYKYKYDNRILWICGTNYLGKYSSDTGASYMFTKHLLPCGWASWSNKFLEYYDGELELAEDQELVNRVKYEYENKSLYEQQISSVNRELKRKHAGIKYNSWDFQMAFSIRAENLYGISPCNNQIKNIGVDEFSEHGGSSFDNVMTRRFCGMDSYPLNFPLVHPKTVLIDREYEKKITNIILYPLSIRIQNKMVSSIKKILGIDVNDSFTGNLKKYLRRNKK
jgi:hypothetical protein